MEIGFINPCIRKSLLKLFLYGAIITAAVYFVSSYFPKEKDIMTDILTLWIAFIIFLAAAAWVISRFRFLQVADDSIFVQTGILNIKQKRIPYTHITNSTFEQTFVERILGIGILKIDTAGTGAVEIIFDDIRKKEADGVLEIIIKKTKLNT